MRLNRLLAVAAAPLLVVQSALAQDAADPASAGAGATSTSTSTGLNWASLSGGDDWSSQVLQSMFPSASVTAGQTGFTSIVGSMLGHISGYVILLAMFYFSYSMLVQIHKVGESGKIMSETFSGWVPVRLAFAIICMTPTPSGFSLGQQLVVKSATFGIGMGRNLYNVVIEGIGPDAIPLANPVIPGTKKLVLGLIEDELCRAIINMAANNSALVPAPTFTGGSGASNLPGATTLAYRFGTGFSFGAPVCGSVTVQTMPQNAGTVAGVSTDMADQQKAILQDVISTDIRSQVGAVATQLWTTRQASALSGLEPILQAATAHYYSALGAAASAAVSQMRANVSRDSVTNGSDADAGETQMEALGWTAAGSYYLEIARLNGVVLGLMSSIPRVTAPDYQGLGMGLSSDVAPLIEAMENYQQQMDAYITVNDGEDVPGGGSQLYAGASPAEDSATVLESVLRSVHINERVLEGFLIFASPTSTSWNDPFAAMIGLGHALISTSLTVMGMTAVLSTTAGATIAVAGSVLTGNVGAAVGSLAGSMVVKTLVVPIYAVCLAMLTPGIVLAFVLPATPYAIWLAGVAGWFVLVCEAVVAVPFWMLAHLILQGEGLHGRGVVGYGLILNIMFRPVFMMAGLILGYVVFGAMSWLLMRSFAVMAGFIFQNGWLLTNFIGTVVLICMFVGMEMKLALMSFKLISTIPHQMPALLGLSPAGRVDMEGFAEETTGAGFKPAVNELSTGVRGGFQALTKEDTKDDKKKVTPPNEPSIDATLAALTTIIPPAPEEA